MDRTVYLVNVGEIYKVLMDNEPDPHTGLYYHCVFDGDVHDNKEFNNPLFNIKDVLRMEHLPIELVDYPITTGICSSCLENKLKK